MQASPSDPLVPAVGGPGAAAAAPVPSDRLVPETLQRGLQRMVVQTGAGMVLGGLAALVLFRGGGGGSSAARKSLAGLGAGFGLGSAWTRTSMDLEELLADVNGK